MHLKDVLLRMRNVGDKVSEQVRQVLEALQLKHEYKQG